MRRLSSVGQLGGGGVPNRASKPMPKSRPIKAAAPRARPPSSEAGAADVLLGMQGLAGNRALAGLIVQRDAAADLERAMHGFGTDEETIYSTLRGKTAAQWQAIEATYLARVGRTLDSDLRDDLNDAEYAKVQAKRPVGGRTDVELDVLVLAIRKAIARHESEERPRESSIRTSSGNRASVSSQVQATMSWSVSSLLEVDEAALAPFGLTHALLRSANAVMNATEQLWKAVLASGEDVTAESYARDNQALVARTHLEVEDLVRMFRFRDLRNEVRRAMAEDVPAIVTDLEALTDQQLWARSIARERDKAHVGATPQGATAAQRVALRRQIARREALQAVARDSADARALGMTYGNSIDAMQRGPSWREDLAGWYRVALRRMQTNVQPVAGQQFDASVGQRIEAAATHDEGLWLAYQRFDWLARRFLGKAANADASDEDVLQHVAGKHNSHSNYVTDVLAHFRAANGVADQECSVHRRLPAT
jgi:annexin-like protein